MIFPNGLATLRVYKAELLLTLQVAERHYLRAAGELMELHKTVTHERIQAYATTINPQTLRIADDAGDVGAVAVCALFVHSHSMAQWACGALDTGYMTVPLEDGDMLVNGDLFTHAQAGQQLMWTALELMEVLAAGGTVAPGQVEAAIGKAISQQATKAVNTWHDRPGGSRDLTRRTREEWASGRHDSRNACARWMVEEVKRLFPEHEKKADATLFGTLRGYLDNEPEPVRKM